MSRTYSSEVRPDPSFLNNATDINRTWACTNATATSEGSCAHAQEWQDTWCRQYASRAPEARRTRTPEGTDDYLSENLGNQAVAKRMDTIINNSSPQERQPKTLQKLQNHQSNQSARKDMLNRLRGWSEEILAEE